MARVTKSFCDSPSLPDFLEDYLFVTVGKVGGATSDTQQHIIEVREYENREKLGEILKLMLNDS